jgi:hypothetical protein
VGVSSIEGGKWRMMRWVRVKEDYRIRGVKSSVFAERERKVSKSDFSLTL